MVSTGMEFKGGDVAEWYLTGELVCPFAAEQLPETDVHHTMNNTFIGLGIVQSRQFFRQFAFFRERETVEGFEK